MLTEDTKCCYNLLISKKARFLNKNSIIFLLNCAQKCIIILHNSSKYCVIWNELYWGYSNHGRLGHCFLLPIFPGRPKWRTVFAEVYAPLFSTWNTTTRNFFSVIQLFWFVSNWLTGTSNYFWCAGTSFFGSDCLCSIFRFALSVLLHSTG